MASTITSPPMLDSTGQEILTKLQLIKNAIGNIPASVANEINYDNTDSGLNATNVQDALDEVVTELNTKQDELTFDATPTAGSDNPVKSYGIYDAMYSRIPLDGMGRNLLDNPFFVQAGELPVNQRGQSNYSSGYTIDRWKIVANGTVNLIASGLSYTRTASGNGFAQFFSPSVVAGKNINASVLLGNDTLISQTASIPASPVAYTNYINKTEGSVTLQCYQNGSGQFVFQISTTDNNSVVLVAAKLEWGTGQTLAHKDSNNVWVLNEIPDYEAELIKCQTSTADSSDTYANKSLATEQQIAYVETGTTTSRAYSVGEYFCWHGLLYRVTTAISNGGDIKPGTNCEAVTGGGINQLINVVRVNRQILASSITTGLNTISVAPTAISGYKPIGVVGVQFAAVDRSKINLIEFLIDSGQLVTVRFNSTYTKSSGISVSAFVLYIRE